MMIGRIAGLGANLVDLADEISDWSQKTFGLDTERGPLGALKHLEEEAREAQANPYGKEELADCLILLLDAARRADTSPSVLVQAARDKMKINKARVHPPYVPWMFRAPVYEDGLHHWFAEANRDGITVSALGKTAQEAQENLRKKVKDFNYGVIHHQKQVSERPLKVCLCGSTRFENAYKDALREETLKGRIVLSVGLLGHGEGLDMDGPVKAMLDELPLRKIDEADCVRVVHQNIAVCSRCEKPTDSHLRDDGTTRCCGQSWKGKDYWGESTQREITYATLKGKPVHYGPVP